MISVGATGDDGRVAGFSSFGKVDVVAPGDCVAVAGIAGFDQDRGCPGDGTAGVAFNSGTSFAAPIVSGVLALADSRSPLVARLALASSADEDNPDGDEDATQWAHGLADAAAFVDAHDPDAPPALVLETTGGAGDDHRIGSGDGQLPHPDTTWVAWAFQAAEGVAANPGTASFAGAASGTAAFAATGDDPAPSGPAWTAARWTRACGRRRPPPPSTGSRPAPRSPCWPWRPTTRRPGSTWSKATTTPGGGWTASTARTSTTSTPSPSAGATVST